MDYIIIILLVINLILGVVALFKNINESNITERLGKLELSMMKEMGDFKTDLSRNMNKDFQDLNEQLERRLLAINEKVNTRLDENFEKTNNPKASPAEVFLKTTALLRGRLLKVVT